MLRSFRTLVPLAALVLLGAPNAGAVVTGSLPYEEHQLSSRQ